jgi:hypothetical protein
MVEKQKVVVVAPAYPAQFLQTYGGLGKDEAKREADRMVEQAARAIRRVSPLA